jgi:hypothetical protein
MDHPRDGEAREIGIFDLETGTARRIELPATCWHVVADGTADVFYCLSFRVLPQGQEDYYDLAMAYLKEYAFEIDAETGRVLRHWVCSRDVPAHINSDITISDREVIFCTGASQTILFIDRESFAHYRMIDERPDLKTLSSNKRALANSCCIVPRQPIPDSRHLRQALRYRFAIRIPFMPVSSRKISPYSSRPTGA